MIIRKLSKSLAAVLCALLLIASSVAVSYAEITEQYAFTDDASYFDEEQTASLTEKLAAAGEATGWQFIIHTSDVGITADEMDSYYNDVYYDGQDFEKNSVMLVFDIASDKRIIITHGDAMYFFDDDRMTEIKWNMKPYLDNGDFYGAAVEFIETSQQYFNLGKGTGSTENIKINEKRDYPLLYSFKNYGIFVIPVALIVGVIVFVVVNSKYKHLGTSGTYNLAQNSSVNIVEKEDEFITKHTTVRRISSDNDSGSSSSSSGGGGGGGGSSHGSSGAF